MDKEWNAYYEQLLIDTRKAFFKLFENGEHFYYCTLTTTGDGLTPVISAWSHEALERATRDNPEEKEYIEWSYSDSPYYAWEYDSFAKTTELLKKRPGMMDLNDDEWDKEIDCRMEVMESVMAQLDKEGIFSFNQDRREIVVLAEIMPPDYSNVMIAQRLNEADNPMLLKWMEDAAELLSEEDMDE